MSSDLFAWDLVYNSIQNDIRKEDDVVIAIIHWCLLKYGFKFIGIGDSRFVSPDDRPTELLVEGWNHDSEYKLRYLADNKIYLLRAYNTSGDLIINFLRMDDLVIQSCAFKSNNIVKALQGPMASLVPTHDELISKVRNELIDPVFKRDTHAAAGTQTKDERRSEMPRAQPLPHYPPRWIGNDGDDYFPSTRSIHPLADPRNIGRADLDPLGSPFGGGMVFNPFRPPRRDEGDPSRPGGARYDPVGPPGIGIGGGFRRSGPSPDHFRPPDFHDNMFL